MKNNVAFNNPYLSFPKAQQKRKGIVAALSLNERALMAPNAVRGQEETLPLLRSVCFFKMSVFSHLLMEKEILGEKN